MSRDFTATPAQLLRAHTDPALFAQWIGPDALTTRIEHWDARTGGSWRFVSAHEGTEYGFHGCFHEIRPDRIVQTFTYEGDPDGVALEKLSFEDVKDPTHMGVYRVDLGSLGFPPRESTDVPDLAARVVAIPRSGAA